jgi:replicative DNA helicase
MQTIIQHNIRLGKRVLWVTLEGNQRALEEMLWCGILKVTREQYRTMALSDNPAFEGVFSAIAGLMKNNIIHLHSQRAGQTAEDVESMIRSHITNMKATSGHGFDLVVLDYPAILELGATHIKMEARQSTQKVYRRFFDLAGEENFHLCTAIQSNRESIKNSRGLNGFSGKNRLLTKESVSEAWGVAHDAPMVATLNRNDDDVTNNLLTVYIDKSRNGETGWAVTCRTDYARGRTHSEDLGAFAYRGTSSMADKANYLLESFKNKEITREQLKEFNNGKEEKDV